MANILLPYVFPISVITPVPAASTAFLKQICFVCKPKSGQEANVGQLFACTSSAQVAARTDNVNALRAFAGGMAKVFILLASDLSLAAELEEHGQEFYTLIVSDDFSDNEFGGAKASGTITISSYANLVSGYDDSIQIGDEVFVAQAGAVTPGDNTFQAVTSNDITAASLRAQINAHPILKDLVVAGGTAASVTITAKARGVAGNLIALVYDDNDANVGASVSGALLTGGTAAHDIGTYDGVVAFSSTDDDLLVEWAAVTRYCVFDTATLAQEGINMSFAFGKLLSNASNWLDQQFVQMPVNDGIASLGTAEDRFNKRISFVLNDTQYSNRLGFFGAGGEPITAPYIIKNLTVDLQSRALQWIADNQPKYTIRYASLLESRLQEDVIELYKTRRWIEEGTVQVTLENDNFVAKASINISKPTALWRIQGEMQQSL